MLRLPAQISGCLVDDLCYGLDQASTERVTSGHPNHADDPLDPQSTTQGSKLNGHLSSHKSSARMMSPFAIIMPTYVK
jgi:hypothetical protein